MNDLTILQEQLAAILEKFSNYILKIIEATGGEAFYGRIFLINGIELIGLIENLSVNEHKAIFALTEEKFVEGKTTTTTTQQSIRFEEIVRIEPLRTKTTNRPIFVRK